MRLNWFKTKYNTVNLSADKWLGFHGNFGSLYVNKQPSLKVIQNKDVFLILSDNKKKDLNYLSRFYNHFKNASIGYSVKLRLFGIGYKIEIKQNKKYMLLQFRLGYSHPIDVKLPIGMSFKRYNEKSSIYIFSFEHVQYLKNFTSLIKKLRMPDPYKGKGLRYENELIKRKEGKKSNL